MQISKRRYLRGLLCLLTTTMSWFLSLIFSHEFSWTPAPPAPTSAPTLHKYANLLNNDCPPLENEICNKFYLKIISQPWGNIPSASRSTATVSYKPPRGGKLAGNSGGKLEAVNAYSAVCGRGGSRQRMAEGGNRAGSEWYWLGLGRGGRGRNWSGGLFPGKNQSVYTVVEMMMYVMRMYLFICRVNRLVWWCCVGKNF